MLTAFENESIKATFEGNKENAMMAAGEGAQRIKDMPKVSDMVQEIVREAEDILRNVPQKLLG